MRPRVLMVGLLLGLTLLTPAASSGTRTSKSFYELRSITLGDKHIRVLFKSRLINDEYATWNIVALSQNHRFALMSEAVGDPWFGAHNLYLTDIHGHPLRLLLSQTRDTIVGSWAPDAQSFAYGSGYGVSSCGGSGNDFRVGSPDSDQTVDVGVATSFAWGPHGSYVLDKWCNGNTQQLVYTDPQGIAHVIPTPPNWEGGGVVSPRGDRLAYGTYGTWGEPVVHIASTSSGRELGTIDNAESVTWAPGGGRFAFVKDDRNRPGLGFGAIAVADANGKHLRTLVPATWPPPYFGFPSWSPDGRFIAFERDHYLTIGIVKASGGGRRYIVHHWPVVQFDGWSSDSRRIYYEGVFQ